LQATQRPFDWGKGVRHLVHFFCFSFLGVVAEGDTAAVVGT